MYINFSRAVEPTLKSLVWAVSAPALFLGTEMPRICNNSKKNFMFSNFKYIVYENPQFSFIRYLSLHLPKLSMAVFHTNFDCEFDFSPWPGPLRLWEPIRLFDGSSGSLKKTHKNGAVLPRFWLRLYSPNFFQPACVFVKC